MTYCGRAVWRVGVYGAMHAGKASTSAIDSVELLLLALHWTSTVHTVHQPTSTFCLSQPPPASLAGD